MKRKRPPAPLPVPAKEPAVAPEELVEQARAAVQAERVAKTSTCVVCGGECAPNSAEGLCWVCRRLRFSAWRDADTQMPAQE